MALFKNNNTEIDALVAVEDAVKTKMKEIAKIEDAGERLLQYKELRDKVDAGLDYDKTYKQTYAAFGSSVRTNRNDEYINKESAFSGNGMLAGGWTGGILGIAGAIPTAIVITGPLFGAGLAIAGGFALFAASTALCMFAGSTIGKFCYSRLPAEDKHANRMLTLKGKLIGFIKKATEPNYKNFQAIAASSETAKVTKAFPDFADAFKKAVELDKKREDILQTKTVETPELPTAIQGGDDQIETCTIKTKRPGTKEKKPGDYSEIRSATL